MRNKFEALKAFIDWPEDWQRLCMLVWAESDNAPTAEQSMQAEPVRDCIDTGEMKLKGIPSIGDPFPYDRTRAVRRAAVKRPVFHFMRYTRDQLGEIDFYLSNGGRPLETARLMDKKHPKQRTIEAWEKMVHRVKKHGLEKMLENAIDMEVE